MGFTKLDEGIIYSSIMGENDSVFRVWIILLATCKSNGISPLSPVFIKNLTGKSLEEVNKCLEILSLPDLSSRSKNDEGRRIKSVDGGYQIVNYYKYREYSYSDSPEAIRQRKHRAKCDISLPVTRSRDISASASASASASGIKDVGIKKEVKKKDNVDEKAKKYYYLSELLIIKLKVINHEIKIVPKRDIPAWATHFRLMVELDHRTEKEIETKIEEIFVDNFWSGVILSAKTLREKWNQGKLNCLKGSQNAQEDQGTAKPMTPWQELCRDSGDPGQRVYDKFIKVWEGFAPGEWRKYEYLPGRPSDVGVMKPVFEIMQNFKGRSNVEMVEAVKKYFEGVDGEY